MNAYDIVIIGASAAGTTTAVTARKFYETKSILVVRDAQNVPIPCGIPYIFGTVGDPMKNLIPVDNIMKNNGIDVLVDPVIKIDKVNKIIHTKNDKISYDRLVITTGSIPMVPKIKGVELENVFTIKKDVSYLSNLLSFAKEPKDIVIIGGGFIGVEMAEELKKLNQSHKVTIIEMQEHCLNLVYDTDLCIIAEDALKEQGIEIMTNERVVELTGKSCVESVILESKKEIKADIVILGIGFVPNNELAKKENLEIGPKGGIKVDRYMQTSDPNIYACGDCATKFSFFDKKHTGLKLASIATMEARIAGANLFKNSRVNHGVVGCFSTAIHGKCFAAAGLTTNEAIAMGYKIVVGNAESVNRHPGMMPGGAPLKVRLIFEASEGRIIGGQVYGALSGGELINAISAFISQKINAEQVALFQAGTHPLLTASPIAYQLVNAAENAIVQLRKCNKRI